MTRPALDQHEAAVLIRIYAADGERTWRVAKRLGVPTKAVRSVALRLERKGLLARDPHYSAVNDTYWRATEAGRVAYWRLQATADAAIIEGEN